MNIVKSIELSMFPELDDGRIIFRPWGARGACYLLTPDQRVRRARLQVGLYVCWMVAIFFCPETSLGIFGTLGALSGFFMMAGYVLLWLFSRNLPLTEPPPKLTAEQRKKRMQQYNRALGGPVLWILLLASLLFVGSGLLLLVLSGFEWLSLISILFFGACAWIFVWQLRNR